MSGGCVALVGGYIVQRAYKVLIDMDQSSVGVVDMRKMVNLNG